MPNGAPEIVTGIWADLALGVPALFPLAGAINQLKGFYPPGYRAWFVILPSLFAFALYLFIQFQFESIPFYVPIGIAFLVAFVALMIYIVAHISTKPRLQKFTPLAKGLSVAGLLSVYSAFWITATYGFNVLENEINDYQVYRGHVFLQDSGTAVTDARITFYLKGGEELQTTSGPNGRFLKVISKEKHDSVSTVHAEWREPSGNSLYFQTQGTIDSDSTKSIVFRLRRAD